MLLGTDEMLGSEWVEVIAQVKNEQWPLSVACKSHNLSFDLAASAVRDYEAGKDQQLFEHTLGRELSKAIALAYGAQIDAKDLIPRWLHEHGWYDLPPEPQGEIYDRVVERSDAMIVDSVDKKESKND